jgi:hypothetical protein
VLDVRRGVRRGRRHRRHRHAGHLHGRQRQLRQRAIELPYVAAEVCFDGADISTSVLLRGVAVDEVRQGMRVKAVWLPQEQWDYSMSNIEHVVPIDEPDADYETYKELQ